MGLINRSDLCYADYSWNVIPAGYDARVTGPPDSTFLNRHQGYEVQYFINKYAERHSLNSKSQAVKVERIISKELPSHVRSQYNVEQWISDNWNNSQD